MEENNIQGKFSYTVFKNDSYMVSQFITDDGRITVTGPSFDYDKNQEYLLYGDYINHPKYGFQFVMNRFELLMPTKEKEIIDFLSSDLFKGIGKKAATKIYQKLGDNTLIILKDDISQIYDVSLTAKQAESIVETFKNLNSPEKDIIYYLLSNGFTNIESQKIFARFRFATKEVALENPFRYYSEVYAIPFEKVKEFASKIDFSDKESKYKEAYLIYALKQITFQTGNIFITKDELLKAFNNSFIDLDEIISLAINDNYIVTEENRIYLFDDYYDEQIIADRLSNFNGGLIADEKIIDIEIHDLESQYGINYDQKQIDAIKSFFTNDISFIVGGPGTGKTTIVKALSAIFKDIYPFNNLIVVAPTGRAAKRVNEICDIESKTIHSLLKWNKETNTFNFDANTPIEYDTLIIDEFSMVDNSLFASLIKASKNVKKICIIGDNNQLPSIRPGNLLSDFLESNLFNITYLNTNYRQNEGNDIIKLANDIVNNTVDISSYQNSVKFYDINKFDINSLLIFINNDINNGLSLDDIQVLSPMYKGQFGIENLNNVLQSSFNPIEDNEVTKSIGKYTIHQNDKIMQLKNRPTDDVYNGDIGVLKEIDLKEKYVLVDYQDTLVFYNFNDLDDIALAYALSVHKSQGSEYQNVYFIFNKSNIHMLNRNLIYTAISRAKSKLTIICDQSTLEYGLNKVIEKRNTTILKRLFEKA